MKPPEPVHVVKRRREGLLRSLVDGVPYIRFLGVEFDRRGDELTAANAQSMPQPARTCLAPGKKYTQALAARSSTITHSRSCFQTFIQAPDTFHKCGSIPPETDHG